MAGPDLHDFEIIHILSLTVMLMQNSKEKGGVCEAAENHFKTKIIELNFLTMSKSVTDSNLITYSTNTMV
jgi:hypothetical protein